MSMDPIFVFKIIILIHIISSLINIVNSLGYPKEERGFLIGTGVLPVLSQFFSIIAFYKIIKRFRLSKGTCGLGHKFSLMSFHGQDGSPGSVKIYKCKKCQYDTEVSYPTKEEIKEKWGWDVN